MVSKELQNSDLIYVNLMTDVFKIIVKYRRKIIAKYRHLSPSGNRALRSFFIIFKGLLLKQRKRIFLEGESPALIFSDATERRQKL